MSFDIFSFIKQVFNNDTYLLILGENKTSIGNGSVQHHSQEKATGLLLLWFFFVQV